MIGTDIVNISRITLRESFVQRILTEDEQKELYTRKSESRRKEYLAGRFAAKEAIFKATQDPKWLSYAILNQENGKPYVKDHPEIQVSLSHDGGYAIAFVLVIQAPFQHMQELKQ